MCGVSVAVLDLGPIGRKHVHETICNGKTNPITMAWILYSKMLRQQMYCKMYILQHTLSYTVSVFIEKLTTLLFVKNNNNNKNSTNSKLIKLGFKVVFFQINIE